MGSCISTPSKQRDRTKGRGKPRKGTKLQPYNPIAYDPNPEKIRDPTLIVSRVHFVPTTLLQNGGNHWTISLQTTPHSSITLNMSPSTLLGTHIPGHGYRGQLSIIHSNYNIPPTREGLITIPATRGKLVVDFIDAVIEAGSHEYDFTTEGRGCTGWVLDQYFLWMEGGFIHSGFDLIETGINMEWFEGKPRANKPLTRGFYMRDTRGRGWGSGKDGERG